MLDVIYKAPKCFTFRRFLIISSFGKIQDGDDLGDRRRLPAASEPKQCTLSCKAHHRFLLKLKSFLNILTPQKPMGSINLTPLPPQLVPRWDVTFLVSLG